MSDRTDDFNRASLDSNWTAVAWTGFTGMQIVSSLYATGTSNNAFNASYWNLDGWYDDQISEITLTNLASDVDDCGPMVWKSTGGYVFETYTGGMHLGKFDSAGNYTELDTGADADTAVTNDVYTLELTSTNVIGRKNSTQYKNAADTTYRTTRPGIYSYQNSTADLLINAWAATGVRPPFEQEGYRWRKDDGDEDAATWEAAQDTPVTLPVSTTKRLRFIVNASGDQAAKSFKLQYRKQGVASWRDVP